MTCASGQANRCVFGDIVYQLPDVWIAGLAWHPRPGLEIAAMARWIWFHLHDRIDIRLTSPALQAAGLPDHIMFHRGFKDVWDTRVRVAYWIRERLRVGAAMRFETSAVSPGDVNASAVDGFKIQPMVMAELRADARAVVDRRLRIHLHARCDRAPVELRSERSRDVRGRNAGQRRSQLGRAAWSASRGWPARPPTAPTAAPSRTSACR